MILTLKISKTKQDRGLISIEDVYCSTFCVFLMCCFCLVNGWMDSKSSNGHVTDDVTQL